MYSSKYWARDEILIVDDDDLQRELMKNSLEDLGMDIREAANGAEALEVFKDRSPMLVVMDINMPVMNGFEACEEMHKLCGGDGAAIILVTGLEDLASVQKAYDMGAIEFLTKPFDWRMLLMRVKYILRIQQSYLVVQKNMERLAWGQRAAGVGSWRLDLDSECVRVSEETIHLLGLGDDSSCLSFEWMRGAVHGGDLKTLQGAFNQLVNEGSSIDIDMSFDLPGNRSVILHIYGELILDEKGNTRSIIGTVQDITERKQAEDKIRQASALKDQFLANISHELRTPVNGVMGMADLLQMTDMDEEQGMLTGNIVDSAQHLLVVLNDVLDFEALETGSVSLKTDQFHLGQTVQSTSKMVENMAQAKNLRLSIILDNKLPEKVMGDMGRIRQVLLNLVGNAIKFTEHGGVQVLVSQENRESQNVNIRFSVRDTGIGIPLEKQATVFDQFVQVDGSLTREVGGTGLGLAISRDLVELMGGSISLKSREGEGTEVWFDLPLKAVGEVEVKRPLKNSLSPDSSALSGQRKILLVEDNRINQLFTKKALEKLGFQVDVADNGQEALYLIQEESYGIVLMDCQMPVMDGYEATRQIRLLGPDYENIPIIALTAHALKGDREKCIESGMDDYMTKPFVGAGLVEFIKKWLSLDQTVNS